MRKCISNTQDGCQAVNKSRKCLPDPDGHGIIDILSERKNNLMVAHPNRSRMSVEEYLELDRSSPDTKYEYIDGEVYLMAGGSPAHARIAATLIRELGFHLRGGPCDVYTSDAKVRVFGTH